MVEPTPVKTEEGMAELVESAPGTSTGVVEQRREVAHSARSTRLDPTTLYDALPDGDGALR